MTIRPLSDRVIVRRHKAANVTAAGLEIPDIAEDVSFEGTVLFVGPGRYEDGAYTPIPVSPGDEVLFGKFSGQEIEKDVVVIRGDEILGRIHRRVPA